MTTKYRVHEKNTGRTIALVYFTPDPNYPSQIIATITPLTYNSTPDGTELVASVIKYQSFPFGTSEDDMVKSLLGTIGVTADDLEHRIGYAKAPA